MVNNASVFPSTPVLETQDEEWEQMFAVNTRGVFNGSREAARHMTGGGVIINIISTASFEGLPRASLPTWNPSTLSAV